MGCWTRGKGLVLGLFFLGGEANSNRFPVLKPSFLARLQVHHLTADSTTGVAGFLALFLVVLVGGAENTISSIAGTRSKLTWFKGSYEGKHKSSEFEICSMS